MAGDDATIGKVMQTGVTKERARVLAIMNKYRGQAAEVENPEDRERLLLVLGMIRSEIEHG